jgi:hypothetical protein
MDNLSARQVTTSFGGLAKLRMQWKYLPVSVQQVVVAIKFFLLLYGQLIQRDCLGHCHRHRLDLQCAE